MDITIALISGVVSLVVGIVNTFATWNAKQISLETQNKLLHFEKEVLEEWLEKVESKKDADREHARMREDLDALRKSYFERILPAISRMEVTVARVRTDHKGGP